jgi:acyl dehydratase
MSCISDSPTSVMTGQLFFEDFRAGEVVEYGGVNVTAEAIVAFAREFDPQPFHVDPEERSSPPEVLLRRAGTPSRCSSR